MNALACPASLKGVLSAEEAAAALAEGLGGAAELPVADGGEGTLDVLGASLGGEWRTAEVSDPLGRPVVARWLLLDDGTALVESAEAIGLGLVAADEQDPLRASSRGLGELLADVQDADPAEIVVFLGGTATVDGGAGLMEVLGGFRVPVRAACDVRAPLVDAARVFAAQKGATPDQAEELERRLLARRSLAPFRQLPGAGAAGGLGGALAALGAEVVEGAALVLDRIGFHERLEGAELVVTGEGTVDSTTWTGKAPGEVARACRDAVVRCAVFGGRVADRPDGVELYELSGDPTRARADLVELGERLRA
ncbi:MAG TPA: glycerate kinase [Gaiellaceae bacterium]|nr:glycerate kinase [Gaiellaceae bacterium]